MTELAESYTAIMPDWMRASFFNPELTRQRLDTHKYSDNDNVRKMRKMDDLHLLDFNYLLNLFKLRKKISKN